MDYRPVPAADDPAFERLLAYAFALPDGPGDRDRPWDDVGERRGGYRDGDLVAGCLRFDFDVSLRGDRTAMGGVAGVASDPGQRRRGHVRTLLADLLREFADDGVPLAALHPFSRPFYADLGWATCERRVRFDVDPADLGAAAGDVDDAGATGEITPVDLDADREALAAVRETALEGRELVARRTVDWWRRFVLDRWGEPRYARAHRRGGEVVGYLTYTVDEAGPTLRVDELVGVDRAATRRLRRFLADHDSQVDRVVLPRTDVDLLDDLPTDDATATVERGGMVRLTDVERGLSGLPAGDRGGSVVLAVTDGLLDRNDRRFRLNLDGDRIAVEPAPDAAPAATVDVGTLSQLVVGYHGPAAPRRHGGLDVADDADGAIRARLAAAFPERPVGPLEVF